MVEIGESKGRQRLYEKQNSPMLRALRAAALIRSIESSNRRDGITVAPQRLPLLASQNAKPQDRSEEAIRGYSRALNLVFTEGSNSEVTPDFVCKLHKIALDGVVDAGQWKQEGDQIFGFDNVALPSLGGPAVSVAKTPSAIEELCILYQAELKDEEVHPLLAVAAFVFDFLCIHPFRLGNGRISCLLMLSTLCQEGYLIGRYVSLERLLETAQEHYNEALQNSFEGWHEGKHDPIPWLDFFFKIVHSGYLEFEQRASEPVSNRSRKIPLVEVAIDSLPSEFTFQELERTCPGVSRETVGRAIRQLRKKGSLICRRHGSKVGWQKSGDLLPKMKGRVEWHPSPPALFAHRDG
jgi:Fic family protein